MENKLNNILRDLASKANEKYNKERPKQLKELLISRMLDFAKDGNYYLDWKHNDTPNIIEQTNTLMIKEGIKISRRSENINVIRYEW